MTVPCPIDNAPGMGSLEAVQPIGILQEVKELQARMLQFPMPWRTGTIIRHAPSVGLGSFKPTTIPQSHPGPSTSNPYWQRTMKLVATWFPAILSVERQAHQDADSAVAPFKAPAATKAQAEAPRSPCDSLKQLFRIHVWDEAKSKCWPPPRWSAELFFFFLVSNEFLFLKWCLSF